MERTSLFQTIIFAVAGVAIIAGVLVFSFVTGKGSQPAAHMEMWGTIDQLLMENIISGILTQEEGVINVTYTQIDREDFDTEFIERLAEGTGPDIVILPQDLLVKHQNKLLTASYEFYPQRLFKDTFIEEGELFTHSDGIMGMPFTVDPLVMYWNRSHFTNAGIANPPQYWTELVNIAPSLSQVDSTFTISKSAVAMGEIENVRNGKEIFATLLMQAGNPMVIRDENVPGEYDNYVPILDSRLGYKILPAEAALDYFAQFSNPSKNVYSWNRSLPDSQDRFVSGDLSIYFGFASEVDVIKRRNPNLNFDIALMPQSGNGNSHVFGKMNALSIVKSTSNPDEAFRVISKMTEPYAAQSIADELGLPPVRRDLLVEQPDDAFKTVFYQSALRSFGIYEIDKEQTDVILKDMVEAYTSGRMRSSQAVSRAQAELKALIE